MSTKHTPGPWYVGKHGPNGCPTVGSYFGLMTVMVAHSLFEPHQAEEAKANARLIAAAPELLDALQGLVRINEEHNQSFIEVIGKPLNWKDDYLDAARAAIRKALGEEK